MREIVFIFGRKLRNDYESIQSPSSFGNTDTRRLRV
jgi:hypothetical protein